MPASPSTPRSASSDPFPGRHSSCSAAGCLLTAAWVAYHHYLGRHRWRRGPGEHLLRDPDQQRDPADEPRTVAHQGARVGALDRRGAGGARPGTQRGQDQDHLRPRPVLLRRAGFSYAGDPASDPEPALADITLDVAAGETIAFVGGRAPASRPCSTWSSGCSRPPPGGCCSTVGDMATLDLRTYRRHLAIVPQEPLLFAGNVRDNVTYGQPDLPDEAVHEALAAANAWEFVQRLPGRPRRRPSATGARGSRVARSSASRSPAR